MSKEQQHQKTVCVDFDGVLHDYSKGWNGGALGKCLPGAARGTKRLRDAGWKIIIFTTRNDTPELRKWLDDNGISYDYVNENPDQPEGSKNGKLIADVYVDDRGVEHGGNWDKTAERVLNFSPWQERDALEGESVGLDEPDEYRLAGGAYRTNRENLDFYKETYKKHMEDEDFAEGKTDEELRKVSLCNAVSYTIEKAAKSGDVRFLKNGDVCADGGQVKMFDVVLTTNFYGTCYPPALVWDYDDGDFVCLFLDDWSAPELKSDPVLRQVKIHVD